MLIKMCVGAYKKRVLDAYKKVLPEIQRKWVIIFVITLLVIPQNFRLIGSTVIKVL